MTYLVKINFYNSNKHYNFSSDIEGLKVGDKVVVETIKGIELATIIKEPVNIEEYQGTLELKAITRLATPEDIKAFDQNLKKAKGAAKIFEMETNKLMLDMRLLSTEYTLDSTKVVFTYAAADRVDFRELLKVLSSKLKVKIELKQIAPRDRAQLIGGIGMCGLPLCCTTFLGEFDGISLNRAKNQLLTINIPKLSGQCGKLLCCLKYEDDLYTEEKKKYPEIGTKIYIDDDEYKITSYNILSREIRLECPDKILNLPLEEVSKLIGKKNKGAQVFNKKEAKELKESRTTKLEKKEKSEPLDKKDSKDNKKSSSKENKSKQVKDAKKEQHPSKKQTNDAHKKANNNKNLNNSQQKNQSKTDNKEKSNKQNPKNQNKHKPNKKVNKENKVKEEKEN